MAHAIGFIPARFGSSRFPGKILASLDGKPLIQHVWERAARARRLERVLVATDDERIRAAVAGFGGEAILTSPDHPTGTDRVCEAVRQVEAQGQSVDIVLNVQGDEPMLHPEDLDAMVAALEDDSGLEYVTLGESFASLDEVFDLNTCKVVTDSSGNALYFSRSPIPFVRSTGPGGIKPLREALAGRSDPLSAFCRQVGVYGFRRKALDAFTGMDRGRLEALEGLEQLRILEAGRRMRVVVSRHITMDVDTPDDLKRVEDLLAHTEGG
jgi:3-deoxy-manno-octulosonate cytidylyltransferase (CMP-KDO synthetase)